MRQSLVRVQKHELVLLGAGKSALAKAAGAAGKALGAAGLIAAGAAEAKSLRDSLKRGEGYGCLVWSKALTKELKVA